LPAALRCRVDYSQASSAAGAAGVEGQDGACLSGVPPTTRIAKCCARLPQACPGAVSGYSDVLGNGHSLAELWNGRQWSVLRGLESAGFRASRAPAPPSASPSAASSRTGKMWKLLSSRAEHQGPCWTASPAPPPPSAWPWAATTAAKLMWRRRGTARPGGHW